MAKNTFVAEVTFEESSYNSLVLVLKSKDENGDSVLRFQENDHDGESIYRNCQ